LGGGEIPRSLRRKKMIEDTLSLNKIGEQDVVLTGYLRQNNIPVLEENYVQKMNGNNGWSEKRMFRKIASIPDVAVLQARMDGYDLDDVKDLRRFLKDNPDYMTVERMVSHGSPFNIIR
jgi:hypothetical protein